MGEGLNRFSHFFAEAKCQKVWGSFSPDLGASRREGMTAAEEKEGKREWKNVGTAQNGYQEWIYTYMQ